MVQILLLYVLLLLPTFLPSYQKAIAWIVLCFFISFMLLQCLCLPNIHLTYPHPGGHRPHQGLCHLFSTAS